MAVCTNKRILNELLGLFPVAHEPESERQRPVFVPIHENGELPDVAIAYLQENVGIALWQGPPAQLVLLYWTPESAGWFHSGETFFG